MRPDAVSQLDSGERSQRAQENNDMCVLDGERFFIRGVFPMSVEGLDLPYQIGLWVEVSLPAFERIYALWDKNLRGEEPSFTAAVANDIPSMPETSGLVATLTLTGPTTRPNVMLHPVEHPLFGYQSRGITPHRVAEFGKLSARART